MNKKVLWKEPGWQCVSRSIPKEIKKWHRRWVDEPQHRNDYQDIISTWDALLPEETPKDFSEGKLETDDP